MVDVEWRTRTNTRTHTHTHKYGYNYDVDLQTHSPSQYFSAFSASSACCAFDLRFPKTLSAVVEEVVDGVVNNEGVDVDDGRGVEKAEVLVDKHKKARTANSKETKVFGDVIMVEISWIAVAGSSS